MGARMPRLREPIWSASKHPATAPAWRRCPFCVASQHWHQCQTREQQPPTGWQDGTGRAPIVFLPILPILSVVVWLFGGWGLTIYLGGRTWIDDVAGRPTMVRHEPIKNTCLHPYDSVMRRMALESQSGTPIHKESRLLSRNSPMNRNSTGSDSIDSFGRSVSKNSMESDPIDSEAEETGTENR
jgi:hypothetical protein